MECTTLIRLMKKLGNDIWSVIELYRRTKSEGLTPQQVSRILKTTTTTLERQNMDLEGEQARLEVSNKKGAQTFQRLTDSIQKDHKTLEENDYAINQQKRETENLNKEKTRLENIINSIQLNSETCINIKQIVKQEIESIVSNPTRLISLALAGFIRIIKKTSWKITGLVL